jgi:glycosyltransferase involved in cell wall biosynthesis
MRYEHVFAIPAYGDSPYLEQCIRSLKGQSAASHIILCTSTPSAFLKETAQKYGLPLYIREGKSSIRDDWNFAYAMADARYVTIAHQDDMYHKEYAAHLLAAAEKYRDMTVYTTDYVIVKNGRLITGDKMLWVKRLLRLPLRLRFLADRKWVKLAPLMLGNPICCPATTYNKEQLGEPLVDSSYRFALDWENMVKLAERKGRFVCEERPLLYYRVHDGATTKACMEDNSRAAEEREMFSKFWPKPVTALLMRGYQSAYDEYQ